MIANRFKVNFDDTGYKVWDAAGSEIAVETVIDLYRLTTPDQSLKAVSNHHERC